MYKNAYLLYLNTKQFIVAILHLSILGIGTYNKITFLMIPFYLLYKIRKLLKNHYYDLNQLQFQGGGLQPIGTPPYIRHCTHLNIINIVYI